MFWKLPRPLDKWQPRAPQHILKAHGFTQNICYGIVSIRNSNHRYVKIKYTSSCLKLQKYSLEMKSHAIFLFCLIAYHRIWFRQAFVVLTFSVLVFNSNATLPYDWQLSFIHLLNRWLISCYFRSPQWHQFLWDVVLSWPLSCTSRILTSWTTWATAILRWYQSGSSKSSLLSSISCTLPRKCNI
jgi:hypothetical protein